jgi:hypothetical protein
VGAHIYNPNNMGGGDWENHSLRLALGKNVSPYLKNKVKKGWECGSRLRVLGLASTGP